MPKMTYPARNQASRVGHYTVLVDKCLSSACCPLVDFAWYRWAFVERSRGQWR